MTIVHEVKTIFVIMDEKFKKNLDYKLVKEITDGNTKHGKKISIILTMKNFLIYSKASQLILFFLKISFRPA